MFYCKKEALLSWQTTELPFMPEYAQKVQNEGKYKEKVRSALSTKQGFAGIDHLMSIQIPVS